MIKIIIERRNLSLVLNRCDVYTRSCANLKEWVSRKSRDRNNLKDRATACPNFQAQHIPSKTIEVIVRLKIRGEAQQPTSFSVCVITPMKCTHCSVVKCTPQTFYDSFSHFLLFSRSLSLSSWKCRSFVFVHWLATGYRLKVECGSLQFVSIVRYLSCALDSDITLARSCKNLFILLLPEFFFAVVLCWDKFVRATSNGVKETSSNRVSFTANLK